MHRLIIFLSFLLITNPALSLSAKQEHAIIAGFHAPYNQQTIDSVYNKRIQNIKEPVLPQFEFTVREPASDAHWALFWTLQVLDVVTTNEGMKYDCVTEANPLLPNRPSLIRVILHKAIFLQPLVALDNNLEFTDRELLTATLITGGVVASNLRTINVAKGRCTKIR